MLAFVKTLERWVSFFMEKFLIKISVTKKALNISQKTIRTFLDYVKRKIVLKFEANRIKIVEETYATRFKSHILRTYALKREKWNFLFKSAQFLRKSTLFKVLRTSVLNITQKLKIFGFILQLKPWHRNLRHREEFIPH